MALGVFWPRPIVAVDARPTDRRSWARFTTARRSPARMRAAAVASAPEAQGRKPRLWAEPSSVWIDEAEIVSRAYPQDADRARAARVGKPLRNRRGRRAPTARSVVATAGRRDARTSRGSGIVRMRPPQRAGRVGKARPCTPPRLREFLLDDPRESNTEGGIFPAIFGTVMMVFLMSFAVLPLGRAGRACTCASTLGRGRSCARSASR